MPPAVETESADARAAAGSPDHDAPAADPGLFRAGDHLPHRVLRLPGGVSLLVHRRTAVVCLVLVCVTAAAAVAELLTGTFVLSWSSAMDGLWRRDDGLATTVVWGIRLPRLLTGLFAGMALGASGALFQSMARNPLGSPEVVGLVSGAAFAAVVGIVVFGTTRETTALLAMVGAGAAASASYGLSRQHGVSNGHRLILIGIGISAGLQAATTVVLTQPHPDIAIAGQIWLVGSLSARTWTEVAAVGGAVVVLLPTALLASRGMNALELGETLARQLGARPERSRLVMTGCGIGLVGASVAAAGPIGFVALAAPHLTRRLTGSPSIPLLGSALMGASLLLLADALGQNLPMSVRPPVAVVTGVLGGTYLLWMLLTRKGRR
ncbi:iron complex transport system permease protein [Austwickia chelonae]|uniref:FecCD family ABC transporter permease n=1 Tax=Austwickia chelonae TaxID=100225 RepID=UPI0002E72C08|nr:iron chelate uptake ABC transporter family permease subunit [Austwickia chelonae]SEV87443.1 iron complex transport system permease protein [Austwickia chelonae]